MKKAFTDIVVRILCVVSIALVSYTPSFSIPNKTLQGPCDCTSGPIIPIRNGSFEDGPSGDLANGIAPPDWIPTNTVDTGNPGSSVACFPNVLRASCDGAQFVAMYSQPSLGNYNEEIEQTIECLVVGEEYMVKFSQAISNAYSFSSGYIEVTFCGITLQSPTMDASTLPYPGFSSWEEIELGPFVATATSHTLSFRSQSLNDGICPSGKTGSCDDQANGDPTYCAIFFPVSDGTYVFLDGVSICGNSETGSCVERPCDDGDPCTENDVEEVNECDDTVCVPCEGDPIPLCSITVTRPCDDGDPCTENDMEEVNECDEAVCVPCEGDLIPSCTITVVRPCDDGDPCTENDMEEVNECDDAVCVPCAGDLIPSCTITVVRSCDDGDPCTENDIEEVNECDDVVCVPCKGEPSSSCESTVMRSCDDGDPCTENDMEEVDQCNNLFVCVPCTGDPIPSCTITVVRSCDDGDPCTENDIEEVNECDDVVCVPCQGEPFSSCDNTLVRSCDDGDPCTINDVEEVDICDNTNICVPCEGVFIDCSNGQTQREPCDDGNSNTINDSLTVLVCDGTVCIPCEGQPVDCTNGNTIEVSCDDGDPCTTNDTQTVVDSTGQICIPCAGIPLDCGGAEVCELTRPCDDGNPCTIDDVETILLRDSSLCIPCLGVELNPSITIDSVVCNDDRTSYSVYLTTNFEEISNDQNGVVSDLGGGNFVISGINLLESVNIILTYTGTGCFTELSVDPPNCDCNAIADAGPDQIINCYNNGAVLLGGLQTSIGNGFSYSWIDSNGDQIGTEDTLTVGSAGSYTLIVTDLVRDCVDSSTVLVSNEINEPLAIIYADPDTIINCVVGSVNLSSTFQPNVRYEWYINSAIASQNDFVEVTTASTVTLVAIDTITGCQNESSIEVISNENYPLIFFESINELTCIDTLVEIKLTTSSSTGNSFVHQWYSINGIELLGEENISLIVSESGQYIFETIDTINNCIHRDTALVTENLELPEIDAGVDTSFSCNENSIFLSAIADNATGYQLFWSTNNGTILSGDQSLNPEISGSAWYYLLARDGQNGCISIDSVFVGGSNSISSMVSFNPPSCFDSSDGQIQIELLGAEEPINYSINGDSTRTVGLFENLSADSYLVEAIDAEGCLFDTLIVLNGSNPPLLQLSQDYFVIEGASSISVNLLTNVTDIDSILWSGDLSVNCENCLNPRLRIEESGVYTVTVIDENGCEVSAELTVVIEEKIEIYIPSVFSPNADNINDQLFIYSANDNLIVERMEIYDRWGSKVFLKENFQINDRSNGWNGEYKGQPLDPAVFVYVVVVRDENGEKYLFSGDITLVK